MFEDPAPIEDETEAFRMTLTEGVATFEMKEHYTSQGAARVPVEEYLRAWEIDLALQRNRTSLRFVFDEARVIDRDPPPPPPPGSPQTIDLSGHALALSSALGTLTVITSEKHYPEPPKDFVASTDARAMWEQYEAYLEGRDRLLPMAYSCLTRLEFRAGTKDKRRKAANMYRIDYNVLDKLGALTNNLGDEVGARKLSPQSELRPPNPKEVAWIEAALRQIIRRAGEYAADPQKAWPQVKMTDLPPL